MAGRSDKKSAARRRAEEHVTGFQTTVLNIPEGVNFFDFSVGIHLVDVVPYMVKKGKETPGGNPFASAGELYYERTFWAYRRIGPEEKDYVCPSKTFGEPDYIQEYRQQKARDPNVKPEDLKPFDPKERQIFLLWKKDDPKNKGIQILDLSFHLFGKLLDSRIQNSSEAEGWDLFYFPDTDGMTLRITIEEQSGGGYKWNEATAIDFIPRREPLPDRIVNHGIDLDTLPRRVTYDELKSAFIGVKTKSEEKKKEEVPDDEVPFDKERETEKPFAQVNTDREVEQKKKEEPKQEKASHCFEKGMEVIWKGKIHRITRLSDDTLTVNLLDEVNDDMSKNVSILEISLPQVENKKEETKPKTAGELGLKKDVKVIYKSLNCSVARVNDDQLTMTLIDTEDDVYKNVPVGDVKIITDEVKKEEPKQEKKKEEPKQEKKKEEPKQEKKSAVADEDDDPEWDATWSTP